MRTLETAVSLCPVPREHLTYIEKKVCTDIDRRIITGMVVHAMIKMKTTIDRRY